MAYCSNCGNQTEDTDRFCTGCGAAVAAALLSSSDAPPQPAPTASAQPPPQTGPLSRPAIPAGLDIANNWGLFLLAGGLLMGLIALFIDWQESGVFGAGLNGIDWIKESEWFADDGAEWWIGLLALLSFIGVGLLALTLLGKVVPGSPIPGVPGIGGFRRGAAGPGSSIHPRGIRAVVGQRSRRG